MAKQVQKKKGANGYKLPDPLPKGEILNDLAKKKWKLGSSIGQGGFGEIYSAQEVNAKGSVYPYVVKIEPHENGPLFVEINFYIRNAKPQLVEEFRNKKKLKTFGMPTYLGSGSHEHKGQKYRFLVMEKFGTDIWKLFLKNNRSFPAPTVFILGIQMIDILEYIHDLGYVHADIKGANILLGSSKETQNQAYLVDYGLATKFETGKEFKPNPKKAHDGTIEYLSRDAHKGVPTRRGDLEILAYNLIQWLGCVLPWENNLTNPVKVQENKEKNMSNVTNFLKTCFGSKNAPNCIPEFLKYINSLSYDAKPDYAKIKKMFVMELESSGQKLNAPLLFTSKKSISPSKRKVEEKNTKVKRAKKEESSTESEEIDTTKECKTEKPKPAKNIKTQKLISENNFDGYTPEMKAIAMKKLQNGVDKIGKKTHSIPNSEVIKVQANGELSNGRSRRNVKVIDYKESLSSV